MAENPEIRVNVTGRFEPVLRELRIVMCIILIGAITWKVVNPPVIIGPTMLKLNSLLDKLGGTANSANQFVETISNDYYDPKNPEEGFYWDIDAALQNSTASSRKTYDVLTDIDAAIIGGADSHGQPVSGVILAVNLLVANLGSAVKSLTGDFDRLTDSVDADLKPLGAAITSVQNLADQLTTEMKTGGDVSNTFAALNKAVDDLDKQLTNPDIARILANAGDTSGSLAESAKSLDAVTRPWRKKIGQLQLILKELASFIKFTYPL